MVKGRNSVRAAALQLAVLLLALHASQAAAEVQSSWRRSLQAINSSTSSSGGHNSTETDAELLLEFKDSFLNGDRVLASWAGSDPCSSKWLGISCDASNSVVSMQLPRASIPEALVGFLPSTGWRLPDTLESVNLTGNNITGTLPTTWQLPTSLLSLSLASNRLYGVLDKAVYLPAKLLVLDLSHNTFLGSVPKQFTLPPEDWIFEFGTQDPLEGLTGWWVPSTLREVYLQGNDLSGSLPTWKNTAGDVRLYVLPGNERLCGTVPSTPNYLTATNSSISLRSCRISVPPYTPPSSSPSTSIRFSSSWVAVGISLGVVAVLAAVIAFVTVRKRKMMRAQASALAAQGPDQGPPTYPPPMGMESQGPPPPAFHVGYPPPPDGQTWVHGYPPAFKPAPMVEVEVGNPGDSGETGTRPAPAPHESWRPEGVEHQGGDGASYPPLTHSTPGQPTSATPGQSTSVGQGAVWTAAPVKGEWRR